MDGSVLCLTGILSVIPGDAIHPFACPAFLCRASRVLWARGECREGAEVRVSRSGVPMGTQALAFCAALASVPTTKVCSSHFVKHRDRQRLVVALCPGNLGFSFGRGHTGPCSMGFLCFL